MPASREVLDGAAGTSSGWKRRPDKFLEGARQLLFVMGDATLAIYPFRPESWSGNAKFLNFSEAVSLVLRRPGAPWPWASRSRRRCCCERTRS
jgi:hypothetical protein